MDFWPDCTPALTAPRLAKGKILASGEVGPPGARRGSVRQGDLGAFQALSEEDVLATSEVEQTGDPAIDPVDQVMTIGARTCVKFLPAGTSGKRCPVNGVLPPHCGRVSDGAS